jgi:hypothetical protein
MAKLENKEIKFEPPFVKDLEVSRAITKIYKDLNELAKSTNNFQLKEEGANTEGKEGDIKVVKSTEDDGYALQIRGDDGWLEDKTAKYVSINDTVSVKTEQKKKTLPSTVGGLLPPADYESDWTDLNIAHAYNAAGLVINHGLNAIPRLVQLFCTDDGTNGGFHGVNSSIGQDMDHGITYRLTKTYIRIHTGDRVTWARPVSEAGTPFTPTKIKVFLWK